MHGKCSGYFTSSGVCSFLIQRTRWPQAGAPTMATTVGGRQAAFWRGSNK